MFREMFFLLLFIPLFGEIRTIEGFEQIETEISQADVDTLIVFDIDEVILTALDQALKTPHKEIFRGIANEFMERAKGEEQKKMIERRLSLSYLYPNRVLVEKMIAPLIRKLQGQGIYVLGITRCRSGRYGVIPQVEQWRKEILAKNGINFNQGRFRGVGCSLNFSDSDKDSPRFEEGLLFGKGYAKDQLVSALINELQLPVKTIYIIDDERSNLSKLEALAPYKVYPIEYLGAKKYLKNLSKRQARWQIKKLLQTGQWIEDEDINELGYISGFFQYGIPSYVGTFF
ncbi:MAG: DUF2608 domain-containing protein [Chlamydiia bacterium]